MQKKELEMGEGEGKRRGEKGGGGEGEGRKKKKRGRGRKGKGTAAAEAWDEWGHRRRLRAWLNGNRAVGQIGLAGTEPVTPVLLAYSLSAKSMSQPSHRWSQQETQSGTQGPQPPLSVVTGKLSERLAVQVKCWRSQTTWQGGGVLWLYPGERDGSRDGFLRKQSWFWGC